MIVINTYFDKIKESRRQKPNTLKLTIAPSDSFIRLNKVRPEAFMVIDLPNAGDSLDIIKYLVSDMIHALLGSKVHQGEFYFDEKNIEKFLLNLLRMRYDIYKDKNTFKEVVNCDLEPSEAISIHLNDSPLDFLRLSKGEAEIVIELLLKGVLNK